MNSYRVVAADPPWAFGDKLPGKGRGAAKHYDVMKTEDICMLQLPPIAEDAMLFMWRVAGMQEDALAVMHMWGFDLKSEIVWIKTKNGVVIEDWTKVKEEDLAFGMGRYTRHCHEVCLIGTRGKAASQCVKGRSVRSVFFAEREEHSKKPDKFFHLVEEMTGGEGPYLELFSRQQRAGWVCVGNELGTVLTPRGIERIELGNDLGFQLGDDINGPAGSCSERSDGAAAGGGLGPQEAASGGAGSAEGSAPDPSSNA